VIATLEEAEKPPPLMTEKLAPTLDEAEAKKPPMLFKLNKVVEAEFCNTKALFDAAASSEVVAVRKVKIVEVADTLEVAEIVTIEKLV